MESRRVNEWREAMEGFLCGVRVAKWRGTRLKVRQQKGGSSALACMDSECDRLVAFTYYGSCINCFCSAQLFFFHSSVAKCVYFFRRLILDVFFV